MAIGSRHIRHDWKTFVDWEQKSVRTVCGATTKRHLAGIPGITEQPEVVQLKDRKVWGWCMGCVRSVVSDLRTNEEFLATADPRIVSLHREVSEAIYGQFDWWVNLEVKRREERLAKAARRV